MGSQRHLALLPLSTAHCVLILSEASCPEERAMARDSRSVNTIVTLRGPSMPLRSSCVVVCELLDPRMEQVVQDNQALQKLATYFYSNALESAVLAMAAEEKAAFNVLMLLLQPNSEVGDILSVPSKAIVRGREELCIEVRWARLSP